jgi:hypothetical protein
MMIIVSVFGSYIIFIFRNAPTLHLKQGVLKTFAETGNCEIPEPVE